MFYLKKMNKINIKKKIKNKFKILGLKKKIFKKKIFKIINLKKKILKKLYNFFNIFFFKFYFKKNLDKKYFLSKFFLFYLQFTKRNIFITISNLKKKVLYHNTFKSILDLVERKKSKLFNILLLYLTKSLNIFFKNVIFKYIINIFNKNYINLYYNISRLKKKILKNIFKFIIFFINIKISEQILDRYKLRYLKIISLNFNYLKNRRKIKLIFYNLIIKNCFNGCKLKKL